MTNEELAVKAKEGDKEAEKRLYESVYRLLGLLSYRYYVRNSGVCIRSGTELDDLKQESYFAMLDAVKAYSPESGYAFNSYLNFNCQNRFNELCGNRGKREPLNNCTSLNTTLTGEEDETELEEILPDHDSEKAFQSVENREIRKDIMSALKSLSDEQRLVIELKYFKDKNRREIASEIGRSASEVDGIVYQAFLKLRSPACRDFVKKYRGQL